MYQLLLHSFPARKRNDGVSFYLQDLAVKEYPIKKACRILKYAVKITATLIIIMP